MDRMVGILRGAFLWFFIITGIGILIAGGAHSLVFAVLFLLGIVALALTLKWMHDNKIGEATDAEQGDEG